MKYTCNYEENTDCKKNVKHLQKGMFIKTSKPAPQHNSANQSCAAQCHDLSPAFRFPY